MNKMVSGVKKGSRGSWNKGKHNPMYGKTPSDETKRKQSEAKKGKKNPNYGKTHIEEIRKTMGRDVSGMNNPMYGKTASEETKQKQRVAAIARIERIAGQISPNYNPEACRIIEEYGKQHGYNFQHAENGGEYRVIGYFVDGYDEEQNVVIEIDESRHFTNGKLKKKDVQRQKEITNHLECKFIRIKAEDFLYGEQSK